MIFNNLTEKLDYEWERYFYYIQLISRADYMHKAFEIAAKEAIKNKIATAFKTGALSDSQVNQMMLSDDIVDIIFTKASDKQLITLDSGGHLTEQSFQLIMQSVKY